MKTLSSLFLLPVVCCGLAAAQTYGDSDAQHAQPAATTERPQSERITHGPVVESTGLTSSTIAWSTDTGGSSVVHYGTNRNHLDRMAESPYADSPSGAGLTHRVKIEHLEPGTTYYYMVDSGQGEGTGTDARSAIEQFTTQR
jgi:phosphodiesterase/alkaline phosphatase D-like protein